MSPVRVAFIGLSRDGWAASNLFPPLLASPLVQKYSLTAVSTTSEISASESAKKYTEITGHTVKAYHGDSSRVANDPDVDLVAVSVKVPGHKEAALAVIEAGKDLFIEWPLANGLTEAIEIAEAAKRKDVKSLIGLQTRQSPAINKVKYIIASGKIGRVFATTLIGNTSFWGASVTERNAYLADAKNGAGLLEIGIGHIADMFSYVLGDFASVTATSQTRITTANIVDASEKPTGRIVPKTVPDQIAFTGTLKTGAVYSMHWRAGVASIKGRENLFWQIDGEKGVVRVESAISFPSLHEPKVFLNGEEIELTESGELGNTGRAWLEFSKGASGSYPTIDDAVKNHRVIDAIQRSFKEGRQINL